MASHDQCNYLSEDIIIIHVLPRLPVESLIRCRCVCKTWLHILDSKTFAKSHLTYQNSSSNTNKYIFYDGIHTCTLLTDSDSLFDVSKHSKLYYNHQSFSKELLGRTKVYGVCNGLLCVSDKYDEYRIGDDIYLWNPICRKVKKLPPLEIIMDISSSDYRDCGLIFGYYKDDFKVILIDLFGRRQMVYIYSLETNTWMINDIEGSEYYYDYYVEFPCTKFVNGTAHMLIEDCTSDSQSLVCYNLSNETMLAHKLPYSFDIFGASIEAYGQTVAVVGCTTDDSCWQSLYMLVLRQDNKSNWSWEKKFCIDLQGQKYYTHSVRFFHDNNDKLLLMVRTLFMSRDKHVTKLYCCDPDQVPKLKEFKSFIEKNPEYRSRIHCNCVESLFLLNEAADSVDPFPRMHMEIESSCSSMLFTYFA